MVYCGKCRVERDLPKVVVRTSAEPCQYCGGFQYQQARRVVVGPPGARKQVERPGERMNNFSYPDKLINSMPGSFESEAHKEIEAG